MDLKEKIKRDFGINLQRLRIEKGLSIRALASSSGLEYSQVQRIESGKVNLSLTTIHSLAEGLGVTPDQLFS